jgi:UDP-N-acetylglucosamine 2-epimerase
MSKKILTIVGARPQFIKCAPVSVELRKHFDEILVHTGQHYDEKMSANFFDELSIPKPNYNLGIGGGTQVWQLAQMISQIGEIVQKVEPGLILVYGDTTSTLAGALAANKMNIKLAHVEAGLRSYNRSMPEENNRVLTDHISDFLFVPSNSAINNLQKENIYDGIFNTGDVMFDAVLANIEKAESSSDILDKLELTTKKYYFVTLHRPYNVDNISTLTSILSALNQLEYPVVLPIHPRTLKNIKQNNIETGKNVIVIEPIGYLDSLLLQKNALKVVTDSGGIQKEAYYLNTPCVTLRPETEWVETVEIGANIIVPSRKKEEIIKAINYKQSWANKDIYGNGNASMKILDILFINNSIVFNE